jgi:hypothetical protein
MLKPIARDLIVFTLPRADKEPLLAHLDTMVNIARHARNMAPHELSAVSFFEKLLQILEKA